MASKLVAMFLALSSLLLLAIAVQGCEPYCSGEPATPTPTPPTPATPVGCEPYSCPGTPATPTPPTPATPIGCEPYCPGTPATPTPSTPVTPAVPPPHHEQEAVCPIDVLKLRVCANVLDVVGVKIGVPEHDECCLLLEKLIDLDAAVCLCTAVRANIFGIHLTVPLNIEAILNRCHKQCPSGFTCPV